MICGAMAAPTACIRSVACTIGPIIRGESIHSEQITDNVPEQISLTIYVFIHSKTKRIIINVGYSLHERHVLEHNYKCNFYLFNKITTKLSYNEYY